jgi:hypothetical protein
MALIKREFLPTTDVEYGHAGNELYNIIISNGNFTVIGQMKNPFSLSLEAEWADLLDGTIPGTELFKKLGNTELASGVFTQKYFSKGGFYDIDVEFRVLEDLSEKPQNGKIQSKVVNSARAIGNQMLPSNEGIISSIEGGFKKVGKFIGETELTPTGLLKAGEKAVNNVINAGASRTVNLQIGNFFNCSSMIIKSFKCDYSKEIILDVGPMYADFTLSLQSLQAGHQGGGTYGIDGVLTQQKSRVTIGQ